MDNAFYTSGITDYQAALQEYANELNNEKITEEKLDKPIDEYNETLKEITEPLGVSLIHEPVASAVKAGFKKVLGRTTQAAGRAVSRATQGDLQGAGRALTQPLREGAGELRQLAARGRTIASNLSDGTRAGVNSLRGGRAIRPPVGDPAAPTPAGAGTIGDRPVPRVYEPGGDIPPPPPRSAPGFAEAPVDPTFEAQRQAGIAEALKGEPVEVSAFDPPARPPAQFLRGARAPGETPGDEPFSSADPFSSPRGLSRARGLTQASAANEGDSAATSALRDAARGAQRAARSVVRTGLSTGLEEGGLETAAGIAGETAAAEGGANPIADVIAGVLGIGTLLSGIFGGKKEPEANAPEFIPSAQFGI